MTYTHCRGCGRKLYQGPEKEDGLCSLAPENCTDVAAAWCEDAGRKLASFARPFWKSPAWSVAIDEWLAATR